jgi:hypothetical protein
MFIKLCYRWSDGHCLGLFLFTTFFDNKINLASRRACTCSEAGFNSENGDRTLDVYHQRVAFFYPFLVGISTQCTEMFPVYSGKCLSSKAVQNWVEKFSQGHSKVADNSRRGAEVAETTVK